MKPALKPVVVQDTGPPSWVEEQRIFRSFWKVQLFNEVKIAVDSSLVDWSLGGISMTAFGGLYGHDCEMMADPEYF